MVRSGSACMVTLISNRLPYMATFYINTLKFDCGPLVKLKRVYKNVIQHKGSVNVNLNLYSA